MTITYSQNCSKTGLATFFKLLLRWKGSIYKLLYKELIIFVLIYTALSLSYRLAMNDHQRAGFEKVCMSCEKFTSFIPLTFVLSFYVETIVERWWKVFEAFAWVDRTALHVSCFLHGSDEKSRMIRRSIMRYLSLAHVFVLRDISSAVKKRFPTYEQIVNAGLITEDELKTYMDPECAHHRHWFPIQWCFDLLAKARDEDRINSDYLLHKVTNEVLEYRDHLQELLNYDWISIPLIYTQVATLSVYSFFLTCLLGRQYLSPATPTNGYELDLYVPFFTLLQFLFYVGWLKVAETLINPLGEDDDDFEVNYILDRNLQVGYVMVDEAYNKLPPLERDIHWNELVPEIPYTEASIGLRDCPDIGSANAVHMNVEDFQIASATDQVENSVRRRLSRGILRRLSRQPTIKEDARLSFATNEKIDLPMKLSVSDLESGISGDIPDIVITSEDEKRKSLMNGFVSKLSSSNLKFAEIDPDLAPKSTQSDTFTHVPEIVITSEDESRKNSLNKYGREEFLLEEFKTGTAHKAVPEIFITPASRKSSLNEFARKFSSFDLESENIQLETQTTDIPDIVITPASRKSSMMNEFETNAT